MATILIVEDDAVMRTCLTDSFEPYFKIEVATNGKEGIHMALETIPDLVRALGYKCELIEGEKPVFHLVIKKT